MDKLNLFKDFVKKNPGLIKYVKNGEMSWQKFYEMYDLYDEDENVWKDYLTKTNVDNTINAESAATEATAAATAATATAGVAGIADIFNWLKGIDLDTVREGVGNLQRVIGVVQDFSTKDSATTKPKEEYRPRPLYKHFED